MGNSIKKNPTDANNDYYMNCLNTFEVAVRKNNADKTNAILELMKQKIDLNKRDYNGQTLLFKAGIFDRRQTVRFLLDKKLDVKIKDKNGESFFSFLQDMKFSYGVSFEFKDMEQTFINIFMEKVKIGNIQDVKLALKDGTNIDSIDKFSKTALIYAIENQDTNMARFLLDNGANVNIADKDGDTPLMYAAYLNNYELVKLLMDNNANKNIKNSLGNSAYDLAR